MSFIAKNPLIASETNTSPPTPPNGTRGLFPTKDGWYEIDDEGNITKLGSGSGGGNGNDGKSAYQIALDNGFDGTEEEWLESLKGDAGKDGESVTHVWNGTVLTVTSASGTSSADLKGEKGDSYILTEADKTEIGDSVSAEIEAELNAALLEIITIDEELLIPDGNEVAY